MRFALKKSSVLLVKSVVNEKKYLQQVTGQRADETVFVNAMNKKIFSKTIIKFYKYPIGEFRDEHFILPPQTNKMSLHFDKNGQLVEMEVLYISKHSIQMETTHEYL